MQLLMLHGHVGFAQELKYVGQNNTPVLNFTLGVTDHSQSDESKKTTWFKAALWGTHAENIAKYIFKGKELIVQGRLVPAEDGNPQTYTKNGETRASFDLTVDRVNFCGSRGDYVADEPVASQEEDDIPF